MERGLALPITEPAQTGVSPDGSPMTSRAISKHEFDMLHAPGQGRLPESIYGAAMMAVIRSSQTRSRTVHGVTISVLGGLVLNIIMQFYVLYCTNLYICVPAIKAVRALYAQYHEEVFINGEFSDDAFESFVRTEELCQIPLSQPWFFVAVLICWTATVWADLMESFQYISLWCSLRKPSASHFAIVEARDGSVLLVAADAKTKAFALITIFMPKVLIAVMLWWLGASWLVATTSFQSLLLNAVALAFVTELDELIYTVLVPEDIKATVQSYAIARPLRANNPFAVDDQEVCWESFKARRDRHLFLRIVGMALTVFVVVGLPVLFMRCMQQVLPGYKWDVHGPCESRLSALLSL